MSSLCKKCGGGIITRFTSTNLKYCHDCKDYYDYPLKPGQESLLIEGLKGHAELVSKESRPTNPRNQQAKDT